MSTTTIPGIPYGPMPRAATVASALAWPPRLVVIHDTSNTASAAAEAHYAATRTDPQANWTSAHAYVDAAGPLGSCPLDRQAWAAFSYANQHGWHIEMCGMNAGQPGAPSPAVVAATARLAGQLCDLAGIPKVHLGPADVAAGKAGICGHWDITLGLGVGDHDDPGPAFDWAAFIAAVTEGEHDTMALTDPVPGTDVAGRTAEQILADLENLRNWLITPIGQTKFEPAVPMAGSPLDLLAKALQQPAGTVDAAALTAKLDDVLARLAAAGAALEP